MTSAIIIVADSCVSYALPLLVYPFVVGRRKRATVSSLCDGDVESKDEAMLGRFNVVARKYVFFVCFFGVFLVYQQAREKKNNARYTS